jgi:NTP pyrophosphatase (non-canonical NTP hydrolase)
MNFDEYQDKAVSTAIFPGAGTGTIVYPALGLTGEAGEVAEKVKKIVRDRNGVWDENNREEIAKELGDVLWYVAVLANELDYPLDFIAKLNVEKLASRASRGVLGGSGDNR